jgi:hypothetical protein
VCACVLFFSHSHGARGVAIGSLKEGEGKSSRRKERVGRGPRDQKGLGAVGKVGRSKKGGQGKPRWRPSLPKGSDGF